MNEFGMEMSILRLVFFVLTLGMVQSCAPPVQDGTLSARTRGELDDLAEDIYQDTEEKYHILSKVMVKVMEEALELNTDEGAVTHLQKFASDNEWALGILKDEIDAWYKGMDNKTRTDFLLRLLAEDYPRKMRRLIPRIREKLSGRETALNSFDKLIRVLEFRR